MPYTNYDIEDFVADEYFIQWVKNPSKEHNAFWQSWIGQNPDKKPVIKEAREIVLTLQFKEDKIREERFLEIWSNIAEADKNRGFTVTSHLKKEIPEYKRATYLLWWHKVAAACVLLIGATVFAIYNYQHDTVVRTSYGESRTFFLPDSTKVILNANSTLRYFQYDFEGANRKVWLNGEAFFSVVHKKDNRNFLVHTPELQVEVLGTRFNVNSRRGKSRVVLEEGKVKLDIPLGGKSDLTMEPGEMVEYSRKEKNLSKKKVNTDSYSSWRNNQLVFVSTSLEEIARTLEDNYGYRVVFRDEKLKHERFTGSGSVDDLQGLFIKLNILFELNIHQEGNKLIIEKK